ncbi:MAG: serine protease [Planctomycetaceae bacterium]|jgi:hypothetical protein|nr:serine protease [Planctomycetaceae bacterium]
MKLLTRFENLFLPINKSKIPFGGLQKNPVRKIIILTILAVILNVSILIAEDFGIPKRNPSFTQSSYSTNSPSSGLSVLAVTAQPSMKIGSQVPVSPETQTSPVLSQFPNVVRLVAFDQNGQSFGSGSYIGNYGNYGLILSNWHVIYGANGLVHIHFPNGFSSYGAVILSDQKWDLALVVISQPPCSVPFLPISQTIPKPGDPLWIAGYGSGSYRLAGGHCVRYLAPEIPRDGSAPQYEIVDLSVSARQGDSGGPILNSKGELAGVLFGSDMVRSTAGSYCERVNRFLNQTRAAMETLPSRPEVYFSTIEQGGPRHLLNESSNSAAVTEKPMISSQQQQQQQQQRRADLAGSSMSFGTHSGSRRYTQSVPPSSFSVFEKNVEEIQTSQSNPKEPVKRGLPPMVEEIQTSQPNPTKSEKTGDSPVVPEIPLSPLSFDPNPITSREMRTSRGVRTAAWTEINLSNKFHYGSFGVNSNSSVCSPDKTPIIQQVGHQISENPISEKQISEATTVTNISSEKQNSTNQNNTQHVAIINSESVSEIVSKNDSDQNMVAEENNETAVLSQGLTSISERDNTFHPIIFFSCFFIVSILLLFSFRLLKNDSLTNRYE